MTYLTFQTRLFSLRIIHFLIYLHQKHQFSYGKTKRPQNGFIVVVPLLCTGMWVSAHRIFLNLCKMYNKAVFADSSTLLPPPKISQILLYSARGAGFADRRVAFGTSTFYQIHTFFIKKLFFVDSSTLLPPPRPPKFSYTLPGGLDLLTGV